jgi:peptidoglycan hydrolase-like protein with peptidoglycan-binding domain
MNPPLDRTPHAPPRDRARSQADSRARTAPAARSAARSTSSRAPRTAQVTSGSGHDGFGHDHHHDGHHDGRHGHGPHKVDRRPLLVVGVAATLVCGFFATRGDDAGDIVAPAAAAAPAAVDAAVDTSLPTFSQAAAPAAADPASVPAAAVPAAGEQGADGEDLTNVDTCLMDTLSLRIGETGQGVTCLQQALVAQGFYTGAVTGSFDQATFDAVEAMQTDRNLFVDGVVGRESALSLGIWPDEESFVTRTPPPAPGAVDLAGYRLSSVASAGSDAPPLPANSGEGRRLVYERAGQRVWAVGSEGEIIRSWLVSGSKYSNELPGTHEVYSKSDVSTAWNGKAWLPKMVRWLKTERGAIGFHSIPLHVEDDSPYQTDAELGTRLSGGCQRQAVLDADFLWEWADIGTKVVVI